MNGADPANQDRRRSVDTGGFAVNQIHVCVDSRDEREFGGRVYHGALDKVRVFRGVDQLLLNIEYFLDASNYPAASTQSRHFGKRKERDDMAFGEDSVKDKGPGKKATFVIEVRYRQNATWQGNVTWLDEGLEKPFRSALELIKLLDSSDTGAYGD
jgi:hypothetical protein